MAELTLPLLERLIPETRRQQWATREDVPYPLFGALWPVLLYHPATQVAQIAAQLLGIGGSPFPWIGMFGLAILLPSWLFLIPGEGGWRERLERHVATISSGPVKTAVIEALVIGGIAFLLTPAVGLVNQVIGAEFGWRVQGPETQAPLHAALRNASAGGSLWAWFGMAVAIPALEEWGARGVLLPWLRREMGWSWAILLQAALFGIMHGQPGLFLPTMWLGIACGIAMARTGNLLAPFLLHCVWNTMILVVVRLAA